MLDFLRYRLDFVPCAHGVDELRVLELFQRERGDFSLIRDGDLGWLLGIVRRRGRVVEESSDGRGSLREDLAGWVLVLLVVPDECLPEQPRFSSEGRALEERAFLHAVELTSDYEPGTE